MVTLAFLHITVTTAGAIWVAGIATVMEIYGAAAEIWNATADARKSVGSETIDGRERGKKAVLC
jgi:hypothetical protein